MKKLLIVLLFFAPLGAYSQVTSSGSTTVNWYQERVIGETTYRVDLEISIGEPYEEGSNIKVPYSITKTGDTGIISGSPEVQMISINEPQYSGIASMTAAVGSAGLKKEHAPHQIRMRWTAGTGHTTDAAQDWINPMTINWNAPAPTPTDIMLEPVPDQEWTGTFTNDTNQMQDYDLVFYDVEGNIIETQQMTLYPGDTSNLSMAYNVPFTVSATGSTIDDFGNPIIDTFDAGSSYDALTTDSDFSEGAELTGSVTASDGSQTNLRTLAGVNTAGFDNVNNSIETLRLESIANKDALVATTATGFGQLNNTLENLEINFSGMDSLISTLEGLNFDFSGLDPTTGLEGIRSEIVAQSAQDSANHAAYAQILSDIDEGSSAFYETSLAESADANALLTTIADNTSDSDGVINQLEQNRQESVLNKDYIVSKITDNIGKITELNDTSITNKDAIVAAIRELDGQNEDDQSAPIIAAIENNADSTAESLQDIEDILTAPSEVTEQSFSDPSTLEIEELPSHDLAAMQDAKNKGTEFANELISKIESITIPELPNISSTRVYQYPCNLGTYQGIDLSFTFDLSPQQTIIEAIRNLLKLSVIIGGFLWVVNLLRGTVAQ